MKNILIITILLLSFFQQANSSDKKIKILFKVNDTIISNIDVVNEAKYLRALNKQLVNLDQEKIIKIAQKSLIREIIKQDEIEKFYIIEYENANVDKLLIQLSKKLGFTNMPDFENYLLQSGLQLNEVKKKLVIERTWNRFIYEAFKDKLKINETKILNDLNILIENNTYQKSFKISEIVFLEKDKVSYEKKYQEIVDDINTLGFKDAAIIHSISNTAASGGEIGWINQNQLSDKIYNEIKNLVNGEFSKPIIRAGGSLIIQVNEIKDVLVKTVNKDQELSKMIAMEKNRQLTEYSIIHYKKIENNSYVKEF
jgi:peptidyl-prolyl cis-trans isomerase SurA